MVELPVVEFVFLRSMLLEPEGHFGDATFRI